MAWLGKLAGAALTVVLEWFGKASIQAIREWLATRKREKEIKDAATAARVATEKATTPEERKNAADNTRDNF